ncbi:MAG: hypothetical protein MUE97_06750, partial [Phycisphaerales bacterium]|nr:hypothetical protein [Phycisphaerales bacterium]
MPSARRQRFAVFTLATLTSVILALIAAAPSAARSAQPADPLLPPPNRPGLAQEERFVALVGARITTAPGVVIDRGVIVLRGDRIVSVAPLAPTADAQPAPLVGPPGAEVIDLRGRHIYAGLIDAAVEVDAPRPPADAPGAHWSLRVMPQRTALDAPQAGLNDDARAALRKLGFSVAHV